MAPVVLGLVLDVKVVVGALDGESVDDLVLEVVGLEGGRAPRAQIEDEFVAVAQDEVGARHLHLGVAVHSELTGAAEQEE